MIFMGSELYSYKGVLDSLANRCFASGTNAWTAVDHTAYTIETVRVTLDKRCVTITGWSRRILESATHLFRPHLISNNHGFGELSSTEFEGLTLSGFPH